MNALSALLKGMWMQSSPNHNTRKLPKSWFARLVTVLATVAVLGCSTTKTPDEAARDDTAEDSSGVTAPWMRDVLHPGDVPQVYTDEWRQAENREACALIAPVSLGEGKRASVRSAYFGGGWGVAYDMPDLRSAFGVAGTGAEAAGPSYDEWPFKKEWPDGSSAGYGPEGGSGPNQLAYLRIPGQDCLYNVWSRLGVHHLEMLLEQLRFVQTDE